MAVYFNEETGAYFSEVIKLFVQEFLWDKAAKFLNRECVHNTFSNDYSWSFGTFDSIYRNMIRIANEPHNIRFVKTNLSTGTFKNLEELVLNGINPKAILDCCKLLDKSFTWYHDECGSAYWSNVHKLLHYLANNMEHPKTKENEINSKIKYLWEKQKQLGIVK